MCDFLPRTIAEVDRSVFCEHQREPDAMYIAVFTVSNPSSREEFTAHWRRILADPNVIVRTFVVGGLVVGYVVSYEVLVQGRNYRQIQGLRRCTWRRDLGTDAGVQDDR